MQQANARKGNHSRKNSMHGECGLIAEWLKQC